MNRRWVIKTAVTAAAFLFLGFLYKTTPRDQVVHVDLGVNAAKVEEIRLRYIESKRGTFGPAHDESEPAREVALMYKAGTAPRVVTHEPRLPNGDYAVELEVHTSASIARSRKIISLTGAPVTLPTYDLLSSLAPPAP